MLECPVCHSEFIDIICYEEDSTEVYVCFECGVEFG